MLTFDEAKHEYRWNGEKVPSVTKITGLLDDFSAIPPDILARKAMIGKATHAGVEIINKGGEVDPDSVHDAVRGYLRGYQRFLYENPCRVVLTEQLVYSERFGFAGRLDVLLQMLERKVGFWDRDQLWLPDVKTVAQLRASTQVQTAGYLLALPDQGVPRSQIPRGVIQLKPDSSYHLEAHHGSADEQCFLALLNVYNWRKLNEY